MSIIDDLLSFITNVLLGGKVASKAFMESLTMAERYTNWGQERNDLRDYLSALAYIEKCADNNAPKEETVNIKYRCLCDTLAGAVAVLAAEYTEKRGSLQKKTEETKAEEASLADSISAAAEHIKQLTSDGSLIKARDETKRLDDLRNRHLFLSRSLASGEVSAEDVGNYEHARMQVEEFCQRAEAIVQQLQTAENLAEETRATIQHQIVDEISRTRQRIDSVVPNAGDAAPAPAPETAAAPPPPAE